jgi:dTDP-4-amino-4,6-dideoxygalactose transaminase
MNPYLPCSEPNFWLSCITLDGNCRIEPIEIMDALAKHNIEARPIWKPMHLQPFYTDNDFISTDVGEDIFSRGLCLPSDIKMTEVEQKFVIDIINGYFMR